MTYPLSTTVTAGQPTAADHYNNLRKDALNLGQLEVDVVNLATFLKRFTAGLKIEYLATNRVRVPFNATNPPTLMVNGFMLQAAANVDLPNGLIAGGAATWYIFAVRSAGSTSFSITANTSATEVTDQRLIGQAYWDGSALASIICYYANNGLPAADYDSGWFACVYNTVYTKAHGLGAPPRLVLLYHAADSVGASEWVLVNTVGVSSTVEQACLGITSANVLVTTGASSTLGTISSSRRTSASGYYRIFAWL